MFFDGSDVGVGAVDLNAFAFVDADTILMSFDKALTISTIGVVEKQDVVQFDATSLGDITAGSFSLYLDGSLVGLDTNGENIDALEILPDGRLVVSTGSTFSVPGLSAILSGADEDLIIYNPTTPGPTTPYSWEMYFDGSDVGLANSAGEDVDAVAISAGYLYLSTVDIFSVTGVSGFDEDVLVCHLLSSGDITNCEYQTALYFDGSTWNLSADDIDGLELP